MNVLDRLGQELREYDPEYGRHAPLFGIWPAHLRALLDVARAAEKDWRHITAEMSEALAPLLEDTE